jgi:uncharacterized lipoprotein NlpE involved in copper resistance
MQRRLETSMKWSSTLFLIAFAAATFFSLAGCDKSDEKSGGPAEKAGATMGRAVDRAVEKAGPVMEKAGKALKEAGGKAKEEISEAVDKMRQGEKTSEDKK